MTYGSCHGGFKDASFYSKLDRRALSGNGGELSRRSCRWVGKIGQLRRTGLYPLGMNNSPGACF